MLGKRITGFETHFRSNHISSLLGKKRAISFNNLARLIGFVRNALHPASVMRLCSSAMA